MDNDYGNWVEESRLPATGSAPYEFSDYTQRVVVATLYLIVILVGTIGNTLVILAVLLSKKLRTATNAFVVNLGIANLLTCLVLPLTVVAVLNEDGLPVGLSVCGMPAVLQGTVIGCSMYTLSSIALQRLLLITRPKTIYRVIYTPKKIAVYLVVTWSIPLLVIVLPLLFDVGVVGYDQVYRLCGFPVTDPSSRDYNLIIVGGLYPMPLLTIIVCYILIWRHLHRHAKMVIRAPKASSESMTTNMTVSESVATSHHVQESPAGSSGTFLQSRVSRRQHEVTKNMFYIVSAFVLCATPIAVCMFGDFRPFVPYAYAILVFNSCINPVIYATKHRDFKTVFVCIVRRQWDGIPDPSDFLKTLNKRHCCGRGALYAVQSGRRIEI